MPTLLPTAPPPAGRIVIFLAIAVLSSACPTRDELGPGGDGGDQPDGSDGGGDQRDASDSGPGPVISIVSPASMTYVSGSVQIEVRITGGSASTVQLLRDDVAWQTLSGPPFLYSWATAGAPDSDYILTATATVGGLKVTSEPVIVTVDHTPPRITDVSPSRGNASVTLTDPITVTFSEPVAPASVTSASVQLVASGTAVATTAVLAADGQSLTVTVSNPKALSLPADFTATVATTITDRAGNSLVPLDPPWTWTVPAWIKLPPLASDMAPRLAVDAMGRPQVTYVTLETVSGNGVYNLRVARFQGGSWDTSMGAPTTDVDTARNGYAIALDSKGQPVLAWTASVPAFSGHPKVYVGAWTGTSWNTQFPPLDAVTGSGMDPSLPSVAVDASDRPVVAWRVITGNAPTYDAYAAQWNGTAWTSLTGTGFMGGAGFLQLLDGPKLVLDHKGSPIFGWLEGGGVGSGLSFWSGTTWARSQTLSGGFTPYPAVDATGAALVATRNADLHVFKWDTTITNWTEPVTALTTSPSWSAPRLAIGPDNAPVVAWIDTTTGVRIGVARWTAPAWDTRFGLFNAGQNPASNVPELAVDAHNNIWVAWLEGNAIQVWKSNF